MHTLTRRIAVPAMIVGALLITPAMTGCSVQNLVQGVTGGKVDVGGKKLPSDFPKAVPLVKGEVMFGARVKGDKGDTVWNITMKAPAATTVAEIASAFEAAGFTAGEITGGSDVAGTATFTKDTYSAVVVLAKDDKGNKVANYTVTNTPK
jgi:hypothetical protein